MDAVAPTLTDLAAEAATFAARLQPKKEGATLVTLSGELGAGKTAFTKALALALGVRDTVQSPTFVLMKLYALQDKAFSRLVHIDAYRLEGREALTPLGFDDILKDPSSLIVVEWPELVGLTDADYHITIAPQEDQSRHITYA